jgi:phytoene synthase
MAPDQYCTDYVADTGSNLYYGLMFASTERRHGGTAVHAFARAIGDIGEEFKDPGVAQAKFHWWREELARTWTGAARHPITQALAPFVSTCHLSQAEFLSFIDASQANLDAGRYADFATLRMHVFAIGGLPSWFAAQTFGARHTDTRRYAETLGIAICAAPDSTSRWKTCVDASSMKPIYSHASTTLRSLS